MPFYRWNGTELEPGKVYRWNGTELEPGTVRVWPWIEIDPPTDPGDLDGGTPTTLVYGLALDGGDPTLTVSSGDLVSNLSNPAYTGHRFGSAEWPQETMYAANQLFTRHPYPYNVVGECDLHVLVDGTTLVLYHDASLTFGGTTRAISSMTKAEWDTVTIASPIVGAPAQPAAFWDDPAYQSKSVAAVYGNTRVLLPELKTPNARVPLMNWIAANEAEGSVIVQFAVYNGTAYTANIVAMASAGIYTMPVLYSLPGSGTIPTLATMASDGVYGIMVSTTFLGANPTLITDAHAEGLKVYTFNSNSIATRDAQIALDVDNILTDRPTLVIPASFPGGGTTTQSYDGGVP